jgi:ribosomal protein L11 methyltransferase
VWQVTISTTPEAEEAVSSLLELFFHSPATTYCDAATGARKVTVYPEKIPKSVQALKVTLSGALRELRLGRFKIAIAPLRRENWAESWKRHFKPIDIGNALLIKPGWSKRRPRFGQRVVILDPGLSFGTGHHATTHFCLQQLAACRAPGTKQSFLDIGTGSGILAIAAAKLGYTPVEAFDFDPDAVRVSRENVKKNKVQAKVRPQCRDLTLLPAVASKRHDVICANLVWDLLISEAQKISARLKPGGKLIVAGILRRQFRDVQKMLQQFGLTLETSETHSTWKSGQFVLSQRA